MGLKLVTILAAGSAIAMANLASAAPPIVATEAGPVRGTISDGVVIDRSTMAGWVDNGDELLDPLVAALGRYALAGAKVHADDTPVAVLDPGRGRTKTGRLWVYVRDDRAAASKDAPAVWFQYSSDRKGEHPQKHLANFSGILQADAYGGWGKL